jgi:hypothetical protein
MMALFTLAMALATNAVSPDIPPQFRGEWHIGDAPCDHAAPGHMDISSSAVILEIQEDGSDDEIEFGVRSVRRLNSRETLAIGNWRENTVDNQNTPIRFSLSRDRTQLTLRLPGWRKLFVRCPDVR